MLMNLIVDAHQDLAWNMLTFARDYTRLVHETRQLERGLPVVAHTGNTLLGFPEYQQGKIGIIFATLFAPPARPNKSTWKKSLS